MDELVRYEIYKNESIKFKKKIINVPNTKKYNSKS